MPRLAPIFYANHLAKPVAGSSGRTNCAGRPSSARTPSAARYPLRTALSIVAGQPVCVQSPAIKKFRMGVFCDGRQRSQPGLGENVAALSLTTTDRVSAAAFEEGRIEANSDRQISTISD